MGEAGERMSTLLHDRVVRYLAASGWRAPDVKGEVGELWRHPTSDVVIPVPYELSRGGLDWQVLLDRMAWIEGVSVPDLAARLDADCTLTAVERPVDPPPKWSHPKRRKRTALGLRRPVEMHGRSPWLWPDEPPGGAPWDATNALARADE